MVIVFGEVKQRPENDVKKKHFKIVASLAKHVLNRVDKSLRIMMTHESHLLESTKILFSAFKVLKSSTASFGLFLD